MRPVRITGVGLLCPAGVGADGAVAGRPGPVPGFRARAYVRDRKSLKLMTRGVQLGVSGVVLALADTPGWESVPPARRGLFVGATPQPGDPDDLRPALEAACGADGRGPFDMQRFGRQGYHLIHPLWLVRGLSNNVLGFASAMFDIQGVNSNYCDGALGGWNALVEGARAVAEGRADLVVAGGSDALLEAAPLFPGHKVGEGAAFVVFEPAESGAPDLELRKDALSADEEQMGLLGAATWPVALARGIISART